jgi:hypothetical protein
MKHTRLDISASAPMRFARNAGLAVLATGMLFISVAPWRVAEMPSGMWSPVTAFELMWTPDEVERLFGPAHSVERAMIVASMQRSNTVDYLFMLAYGAFMVSFAGALRAVSAGWARVGVILGLTAVLADALENVCLLSIASSLGSDYNMALRALRYFTWVKWFAIALGCAAWIPGLWRYGFLGRSGAAFAVLSVCTTTVAFVYRGVFAESMALAVQLCWLTALALSIRLTRASNVLAAEAL